MTELVKVTAYVVRKHCGRQQILVFLEEGVASYGLQVPGGTLEPGETLEQCLLREIREEAGLDEVQVSAYLGEHRYYLEKRQANITRHYYALTAANCPEAFTYVVQSQDEDNGWIYHYRWHDLSPELKLGGELGRCLPELFRYLADYSRK